jgi:hypothetical protein
MLANVIPEDAEFQRFAVARTLAPVPALAGLQSAESQPCSGHRRGSWHPQCWAIPEQFSRVFLPRCRLA